MELSDKCMKELQAVVDGEVKQRTGKLRQRVTGVEADRDKIRQERDDVRRQFETEQEARKQAEGRAAKLEKELRESVASEKALKTALAEQEEVKA